MVKKFEFRDHSTKLDIAGHIFRVDVTDTEVLDKIMGFAEEAQKMEFDETEKNYIEQLEDSMQFLQNSIDDILGEGAAKTIFEDRTVSFFDLLDILDYIKTVFINARKEKFAPYDTGRTKR